MVGPRDYHTESEREKQKPYIKAYTWNLKELVQMILFTKHKQKQMQRTNAWIPRGKGRDRMNWETGIDIYTLLTLSIKQMTHESLLCVTGNSTQCCVVT